MLIKINWLLHCEGFSELTNIKWGGGGGGGVSLAQGIKLSYWSI